MAARTPSPAVSGLGLIVLCFVGSAALRLTENGVAFAEELSAAAGDATAADEAIVEAITAAVSMAGVGAEPPSATTSSTAAAPRGLGKFYAQTFDWANCEGGECAELEVPMDYDDPDGETIKIAVLRVKAKGKAAGSLVVNPGGPGGSGVEYAAAADFVVSDQIRKSFDVVGFDPRGVARSHPVDCLDDAALDTFLGADPTPDDEAEQREQEHRAGVPEGVREHGEVEAAAAEQVAQALSGS